MRSRRVISSSRCGRPAPALTIACSIGSGSPRFPVEHCEMPHVRVVRRIEAHDQATALAGDRRPQRSMRVATSPARRVGASNALPSRRTRNASATSVAVRTFGGGAGVSSWRAPSRQIASTIPVNADRGERPCVDILIEREQRSGHRLDQTREPDGIDQRRRPSHRVGTVRIAGASAAPGALGAGGTAPSRHARSARPPRSRPGPASGRSHQCLRPDRRLPRPTSPGRRPLVSPGRRPGHRPAARPGRGESIRRSAHPPSRACARARRRRREARCVPPAHATTRPGSQETCTSTTPGSASRSSTSSRSSRGVPTRSIRTLARLGASLPGFGAPTHPRAVGAPIRGRR